jgi:hypothetical protein
MTVFQDVVPFSLVQINRRFRVAYCTRHQRDDLMMEAVSTSDISSLFQTTWHNIPEESSSYSPM